MGRSWRPFWGLSLENECHGAVMATVFGVTLGKRVPWGGHGDPFEGYPWKMSAMGRSWRPFLVLPLENECHGAVMATLLGVILGKRVPWGGHGDRFGCYPWKTSAMGRSWRPF